MIFKNLSDLGYIKSRPKAYESDGMTVGGNKGFVLASYPRDYPLTPQQKKVRDVAAKCNIKKGISRRELREAMVNCVGPEMRK